jgi:hypothetical protein
LPTAEYHESGDVSRVASRFGIEDFQSSKVFKVEIEGAINETREVRKIPDSMSPNRLLTTRYFFGFILVTL